MTIFANALLRQQTDRDIDDRPVGYGGMLGAVARGAFHEWPVNRLADISELAEAQGNPTLAAAASPRNLLDLSSPAGWANIAVRVGRAAFSDPSPAPEVPIKEAAARVKEAGLEKALKLPEQETIRAPALDIMMRRARERMEREATIARGPDGVMPFALSLGTSFFVSAADPLNVASVFIPVVGEANIARLMASAGTGALARATTRAGIGAVEGAVGVGMLEPLHAYATIQEGADYTMAHALRSIMFGATLGAGLRSGGGAVADAIRARQGRPMFPYDIGERFESHTPFDELPTARTPADTPLTVEPFPGSRDPAPALPDTLQEAERKLGLTPTRTVNVLDDPTLDAQWRDIEALVTARRTAEPSPIVDAVADLPPQAHEDLMRTSLAQLTRGEPVRAGEIIDAAAKTDPRIDESWQLASRLVRLSDEGAAAPRPREESIRIVHDDIAEKLRAAGWFEDAVDENAAMYAARNLARARKLGVDPVELYRSEPLELRRIGEPPLPGMVPDDIIRFNQHGIVRLYRGEGGDTMGSVQGGGWFTTSPAKAALYGDVSFIDVPRDEMALFARGANGADEWVALDPSTIAHFKRTPLAEAARVFDQPTRTAPTFYSAVERAVTDLQQNKASPEQWLAAIRNRAGVKAEEMQWLGLEEWLKAQKGPVNKEVVLDFIRANRIEVREVEKGELSLAQRAGREVTTVDDALELLARQEGKTPEQIREAYGYLNEQDYVTLANNPARADDTKFGQYTLPGGENYRELLLTLPDKNLSRQIEIQAEQRRLRNEMPRTNEQERAAFNEAMGRLEQEMDDLLAGRKAEIFTSPHFEEQNIVAHVRFNDRTIDGKKALFIEEVQSDWAQAARRKGIRGQQEEELQALVKERDTLLAQADARSGDPAYVDRLNELHDRIRELGVADPGVPAAPFITKTDDWAGLTLKRMIRYAAENGYEVLAWTPGKVQAERYDLSKQIDEVVYYPNTNDLQAFRGGAEVIFQKDVTPDKLPDVIGKEAADRILNNPTTKTAAKEGGFNHTLSGVDLKVGGEGMVGFYDKILPAAANKLTKKFGAKVEPQNMEHYAKLGADTFHYDGPDLSANEIRRIAETQTGMTEAVLRKVAERVELGWTLNDAMRGYGSREAAAVLGGRLVDPLVIQPVHTLAITPELRRAAVEEGFPLFQRSAEGEPRGQITLEQNRAIVNLFGSADRSTFMHEMGHLWLDELVRDAARANVPQALKDDLGTVLRWLKVDKAEDIGVTEHEQWARGFEQYLAEGIAPSAGLARAFESFKRWLSEIYRALTDRDSLITDDIRSVMDRMLATEGELLRRPAAPETAIPASGPPPTRAEPQPARRAAFGPAARDTATWTLFEFIASRGGLKPAPDLQYILDGNPRVFGFGNLIRRDGMSLDQAREAAVEAGYLIDAPELEARATGQMQNRPTESTLNDILEAIGKEARGEKQYTMGNERLKADTGEAAFRAEERRAELEAGFNARMEELQITEIKAGERKRALEIMEREGEADGWVALERALMENENRLEEVRLARASTQNANSIPGWDVDDSGPAPRDGGPVAGEVRGQPAETGVGEAPRPNRGGDRAAANRAWQDLARTREPHDEPDAVAALRAADETPVPGSAAEPTPGKRSPAAEAAEKADATIREMYEAARADGRVTEEEHLALEAALARIDEEAATKRQLVRDGMTCLLAGFGAGI